MSGVRGSAKHSLAIKKRADPRDQLCYSLIYNVDGKIRPIALAVFLWSRPHRAFLRSSARVPRGPHCASLRERPKDHVWAISQCSSRTIRQKFSAFSHFDFLPYTEYITVIMPSRHKNAFERSSSQKTYRTFGPKSGISLFCTSVFHSASLPLSIFQNEEQSVKY